MTLGVQEKQNLLKADRLKAVGLDLEAGAKLNDDSDLGRSQRAELARR